MPSPGTGPNSSLMPTLGRIFICSPWVRLEGVCSGLCTLSPGFTGCPGIEVSAGILEFWVGNLEFLAGNLEVLAGNREVLAGNVEVLAEILEVWAGNRVLSVLLASNVTGIVLENIFIVVKTISLSSPTGVLFSEILSTVEELYFAISSSVEASF